jgi:hypothetical protein
MGHTRGPLECTFIPSATSSFLPARNLPAVTSDWSTPVPMAYNGHIFQ